MVEADFEPRNTRSGVGHSTTEPPCSPMLTVNVCKSKVLLKCLIFISIFSGLSLFEQNVTICDALLFAPEKTLGLFDSALAEAQSVVMETCEEKDDMVRYIESRQEKTCLREFRPVST